MPHVSLRLDPTNRIITTWAYQSILLHNGDDHIVITGSYAPISSTDQLPGIPIDSPLNRGEIKYSTTNYPIFTDYHEVYLQIINDAGTIKAMLYADGNPYTYDGEDINVIIRFRHKIPLSLADDEAFAYDNFASRNPRYPLERKYFTVFEMLDHIQSDGTIGFDITTTFQAAFGVNPPVHYIGSSGVGNFQGFIALNVIDIQNPTVKPLIKDYLSIMRYSDTLEPILTENREVVYGILIHDTIGYFDGNPNTWRLAFVYINPDNPDGSGIELYNPPWYNLYYGVGAPEFDLGILKTISLVDMDHMTHATQQFWVPAPDPSTYYRFPYDVARGVGYPGFQTERGIESDMLAIPPRSQVKIPFNAPRPYRHVSMFVTGMMIPMASGMLKTDVDSVSQAIAADRARIYHMNTAGQVHSRNIDIIGRFDFDYTPYTSISRTSLLAKTNPNTSVIQVKSLLGMPKKSTGNNILGQLIINPGGSNEETVSYYGNNVVVNHYNLGDQQDFDFTITLNAPMSSGHFIGEPVVSIPADLPIPEYSYQMGYGPMPFSMAFSQVIKSLYMGTLFDGLIRIKDDGDWVQIPYDWINWNIDGIWEGPLPDDFVYMIGTHMVKTNVIFGYEGVARIVCVCTASLIATSAQKHDGIYTIDEYGRSKFDGYGLPLELQNIPGSLLQWARWTVYPYCISKSTGFEVEPGRPLILGFRNDGGVYAGVLLNGPTWGAFGDTGRTTWVNISGNLPTGNARWINSIATTPDYPGLVAIGTNDGLYITIDLDTAIANHISTYGVLNPGDNVAVTWNKYTPQWGIPNTKCTLAHFDAFTSYEYDQNYMRFNSEMPTLTFTHWIVGSAEVNLPVDVIANPQFAYGYTAKFEILDQNSNVLHTETIEYTEEKDIFTSKLVRDIANNTTYFDAYYAMAAVGFNAEPRMRIRILYKYFEDNSLTVNEVELYRIRVTLFTNTYTEIYAAGGSTGTALIKLNTGTAITQDQLNILFLTSNDPIEYADFLGADTFALLMVNHPNALYMFKNFTSVIEYTQLGYPGCNMFWRNDGEANNPKWNLYAVNPLSSALPIKIIADVETEAIPIGANEPAPNADEINPNFYVKFT